MKSNEWKLTGESRKYKVSVRGKEVLRFIYCRIALHKRDDRMKDR
jgi:hypothetical protein